MVRRWSAACGCSEDQAQAAPLFCGRDASCLGPAARSGLNLIEPLSGDVLALSHSPPCHIKKKESIKNNNHDTIRQE
jgi:hypothetical protein